MITDSDSPVAVPPPFHLESDWEYAKPEGSAIWRPKCEVVVPPRQVLDQGLLPYDLHEKMPHKEAERGRLFSEAFKMSPVERLHNIYVLTPVKDDGGISRIPFRIQPYHADILRVFYDPYFPTKKLFVLKARQVFCTSLLALIMLDKAAFNLHRRISSLVISLDEKKSQEILENRFKFVVENSPHLAYLKPRVTSSGIEFGNSITKGKNTRGASSIKVMRSGVGGTYNGGILLSEFALLVKDRPQEGHKLLRRTAPSAEHYGMTIESTPEDPIGEFLRHRQLKRKSRGHSGNGLTDWIGRCALFRGTRKWRIEFMSPNTSGNPTRRNI